MNNLNSARWISLGVKFCSNKLFLLVFFGFGASLVNIRCHAAQWLVIKIVIEAIYWSLHDVMRFSNWSVNFMVVRQVIKWFSWRSLQDRQLFFLCWGVWYVPWTVHEFRVTPTRVYWIWEKVINLKIIVICLRKKKCYL